MVEFSHIAYNIIQTASSVKVGCNPSNPVQYSKGPYFKFWHDN